MRPPRYRILAEEGVPAPTGGLDTASADTYVPQNRARTLTNFLPGLVGRLPLRGPIAHFKDLPAGVTVLNASGNPRSGGWTGFTNTVLVNGSDSKFYVASFTTPTAPTISTGAVWPGGIPPTQCGGRLGQYVFGTDASGGVQRWSGGTAAGDLVQITNGPTATAISVAVWLDRVFVLGGSNPGTPGGNYIDRLYWTDPNWDGTNVLAAWQDDVSGLVNQIILGDIANWPVALVPFRNQLLIMRRHSIQALVGTSPANFSVRTVAHVGVDGFGLAPTYGIVVHDDGVFFPSSGGYSIYDGASVRRISRQVESGGFLYSTITEDVTTSASLLDDDHMLVRDWLRPFAGVLHIPSGSWSSVDLSGYTAGNPNVVLGRMTDYPFIVGNVSPTVGRVALLEYLTDPITPSQNGTAFLDYGSTAYGGTVESRIIELGSPEAKANLHRILVDSKPLGTTGFTLTVEALDGTVIKTVAIPSSSNDWVQRTVADLDGYEADFVRLKWSLTSATGPAEIQDARIEFQHAQERTG